MRKRHHDMPAAVMPMHDSHSTTVHVRPIENGFVKRVSHSGPDGFSEKETFHRKHPGMGAGRRAGMTEGTPDVAGSAGLAGAKPHC